jgi:hypothetical protein
MLRLPLHVHILVLLELPYWRARVLIGQDKLTSSNLRTVCDRKLGDWPNSIMHINEKLEKLLAEAIGERRKKRVYFSRGLRR